MTSTAKPYPAAKTPTHPVLDEITELIERHREFLPGYSARNDFGGWDYGKNAGKPTAVEFVRTYADDATLHVAAFGTTGLYANASFQGAMASAYIMAAVVEAHI